MRDGVCFKCQRKDMNRHEQGPLQDSKRKSKSTKFVNDDQSNKGSASYRSEGSSDEAFGLYPG